MSEGKRLFEWPLEPLLDEARDVLAARDQAVARAQLEVDRCANEKALAQAALTQSSEAACDAIAAMDQAIREQRPIAARRTREHTATRAQRRARSASIQLESAGEDLNAATAHRDVASAARNSAELYVRELLRLRSRAEHAHDAAEERRLERRRDDDSIERWRPAARQTGPAPGREL